MILMGPALVIAIVVAIAYAVSHRGAAHHLTGPGAGHLPGPPPGPAGSLDDHLARELAEWVDAGLISPGQSRSILDHEHLVHPPAHVPVVERVPGERRSIPPVAEALGYLGGALAIVGLALLVGAQWADLGTPARLAISGVTAAVLTALGFAVHEAADPALARLRWFVWLVSTAAAGLLAGVLAADALDVGDAAGVASIVGAGVAVHSAALWQWRERPIQQITTIGGLAVLVGAGVSVVADAGPAGIALWAMGAVVLALGLARRTPLPLLTEAAGAIVMAAGGIVLASAWQPVGLPLLVATGAGMVTATQVTGLLRTQPERVVLGAVGLVTLLQAVPGAIGYFAERAGVLTGLVMWATGAALVAVARHARVASPVAAHVVGGFSLLGGAAITAIQAPAFATIFGIITAVALVALGTLRGRGVLSVFGSVGLMIFVPWAIGWFFPGEGRAPLLILVSGALILGVALLLARMSGRLRDELGGRQ